MGVQAPRYTPCFLLGTCLGVGNNTPLISLRHQCSTCLQRDSSVARGPPPSTRSSQWVKRKLLKGTYIHTRWLRNSSIGHQSLHSPQNVPLSVSGICQKLSRLRKALALNLCVYQAWSRQPFLPPPFAWLNLSGKWSSFADFLSFLSSGAALHYFSLQRCEQLN